MEVTLKISPYSKENGIEYNWEDEFEIETRIVNGSIHLLANREGLISLANHLLTPA